MTPDEARRIPPAGEPIAPAPVAEPNVQSGDILPIPESSGPPEAAPAAETVQSELIEPTPDQSTPTSPAPQTEAKPGVAADPPHPETKPVAQSSVVAGPNGAVTGLPSIEATVGTLTNAA
ncbi:hypothetical protein HY375_01785 [Candidatus Berkelbacteria bacterium]|nr:hypothetical protein [Candidatus Berkelbacteria bacterium]